jgi:hypothetical protein
MTSQKLSESGGPPNFLHILIFANQKLLLLPPAKSIINKLDMQLSTISFIADVFE